MKVYKNSVLIGTSYLAYSLFQPGQISLTGVITTPGTLVFQKSFSTSNKFKLDDDDLIIAPGQTLEFIISRSSGLSNPIININCTCEYI